MGRFLRRAARLLATAGPWALARWPWLDRPNSTQPPAFIWSMPSTSPWGRPEWRP